MVAGNGLTYQVGSGVGICMLSLKNCKSPDRNQRDKKQVSRPSDDLLARLAIDLRRFRVSKQNMGLNHITFHNKRVAITLF
jgi:hypothetical protein